VLFLRSSTRWQHIDELAHFLGVSPDAFPADSREPHTRKSTRPLQANTASAIDALFSNLTSLQRGLGDFHVVPQVEPPLTAWGISFSKGSAVASDVTITAASPPCVPADSNGAPSSPSSPSSASMTAPAASVVGAGSPTAAVEGARSGTHEGLHAVLLWTNLFLVATTMGMFAWVCRLQRRYRWTPVS
jgi:hypothetical protein